MNKILSLLILTAAASSASAGAMQDALNYGLKAGAPQAAAPAVPASPAATERSVNDGKFCFEVSGDVRSALDSGLPAKFCVSKLSLERLSNGGIKLNVVSDSPKINSGKAEYVFVNGALKYISGMVYEFYDEMYFGEIKLVAPVSANGNLLPGGEVKVTAKGAINPPSGELVYFNVSYNEPLPPPPPQTNGPCFTRPAMELADEVKMPVRFCLAGTLLVRKNNGSLELSVAGDLPGQFKAAYVQKNGATFVKARIFDREEGHMSVNMGAIDILVPAFANGDVDAKGQILVDAVTGHNYDIYHSQMEYQAVPYKAGPAK
ncbi:MAG TPA: hypothetical protein PKI19_00300 [Elusimicrobiales bacterium]|nr:hypothetical protein [Elusimicrobiales bacterium]